MSITPIDWTRIDKITNAYWHNMLWIQAKRRLEEQMSSVSLAPTRTSTVDAFMKSGYSDLVITTLGAEVREYIKQLEARIERQERTINDTVAQRDTYCGHSAEYWANKHDSLERKYSNHWDMNRRSHGYYRWTGQAMEWIGNLEDHVRVTRLESTLRNHIDQAIDALKAARDLTPGQS